MIVLITTNIEFVIHFLGLVAYRTSITGIALFRTVRTIVCCMRLSVINFAYHFLLS